LLSTAVGGEWADELMQVMLPLIDNEVCNQPSWHNGTMDDSMVCAGYEEGLRGNCVVFFISIQTITDNRTVRMH